MTENGWLAERFEAHGSHLKAVAYRILGSPDEAADAVQEAWLRLSRSDAEEIENLGGWLTTVVARVSLDMLRSRGSRREDLVPEPPADRQDSVTPEHEALLADSVGLALLVVLDTLDPAERLAFVLHDMFAVPFDEIAPIVGRSPAASRQLASRARRRVQGKPAVPDPDLARRRTVVEAFLAASRGGDFDALLTVLDPDVVLRADSAGKPGTGPHVVHGAAAVAGQARMFSERSRYTALALVDGSAGLITVVRGHLSGAMRFTVTGDRITELEVITQPAALTTLDLAVL